MMTRKRTYFKFFINNQISVKSVVRLFQVITVVFLSRPVVLFYTVHVRTIGVSLDFMAATSKVPFFCYSTNYSKFYICRSVQGRDGFSFLSTGRHHPFKNCIVDRYTPRKFYCTLPVMWIVKAIHQHRAYVLFQIKQSVTLIFLQNRKNDGLYFQTLQIILGSWCRKHL